MPQTRGAKEGISTYRIVGREAVLVENYFHKVSRHVISESTEASRGAGTGTVVLRGELVRLWRKGFLLGIPGM